jgi:hypothetical protein
MLQLVCPSCGRTLLLSRITSGTGGFRDQHTYSCQLCGVWVIEAANDRVPDGEIPSESGGRTLLEFRDAQICRQFNQ